MSREYAKKRRAYKIVELNHSTDPPKPVEKTIMRNLYEWDAPSAKFRSPDPAILDRRRWAIEGEPEERDEDRSKQPLLKE